MTLTHDTLVRPEFDPTSGSHHVDYDPDRTCEASTVLVLAISSLTGDEATDMLPLERSVDPDVLNCLVRGRERGATLEFEFNGYHVTVRDDGRIEFSKPGFAGQSAP